MLTHGSLFSGIGGFDLAAQWAGWDNIFHCEINPFGQQVLKYYWPNSIQYHDITKTDFTIHRGNIDVLTGGWPCQDNSRANQVNGGGKKDSKAKEASYGNTLKEPFAKYDPDTLSVRTYQMCLQLTEDEISMKFCQDWPEWGTMHNGEFFAHATLAPRTIEPDCIFLLTPAASDHKRSNLSGKMREQRLNTRKSAGCLMEQMYQLGVRGNIAPEFYEWIMGFPIGHTDLKH